MNIRFTFFLSTILLLLLTGCKSDESPIIISEIDLDEELTLDIRENFNENGSAGLLIRLTTDTEYDCQEGKLKNNLIITNQEIIINVVGLDFPVSSECDGRDVASGDIEIDELAVKAQHSIQISLLGEIKNTGFIVNGPERITISLPADTGSGIVLGNSVVYKVPQDVVWGFIDSESIIVPDSIQLAFLNQLESMGSPVEKVGTFGHFTIHNDGSAIINDFEKSNTAANAGFAISFNGDFEELSTLVEDIYCHEDFRIRMWDTFGNQYSCN